MLITGLSVTKKLLTGCKSNFKDIRIMDSDCGEYYLRIPAK